MRFLVSSSPKHMIPPEMVPNLLDALLGWVGQHTASGKLEFVWNYAGRDGGGGILNVDSLEELDAIMVGFPLGPFSEVEIHALSDLEDSVQGAKAAFQAMAGG
jgi:muconolactone delta-isomerase